MSKGKILVVEDDLFLRELYTDTLKDEGYEVENASDGEEAYEKIQKSGWDLILLDIILPKMDGLEIMKKVKENNLKPAKSIVFLTNLDKDEEIKEALKFGDGYIIKSQMTPGDLTNEIQLYLHRSNP